MTIAPLASVRADALALWERSAVRTPFNHPAFMEAAGEAFGMQPLAMLGAEGRCGVIGLEKKRGPLRVLALVPAAAYSSPLCEVLPPEARILERETPLDALREAIESRFALASFSLPPAWTDPRTFSFAGWEATTRFTSIADLSGDPTANWSKGTRRPATQFAGDFEVQEGTAAVAAAAQFQVQSYETKDLSFGLSISALESVGHALHDEGLARAFAASRIGVNTPEAAALFAIDGSQATYWLAGSRRGPAMAVLFQHAVRALAASGVTTLDLGGANVPGVAQFKRQVGGVLTPTVVVRRVGPRWLRIADALR